MKLSGGFQTDTKTMCMHVEELLNSVCSDEGVVVCLSCVEIDFAETLNGNKRYSYVFITSDVKTEEKNKAGNIKTVFFDREKDDIDKDFIFQLLEGKKLAAFLIPDASEFFADFPDALPAIRALCEEFSVPLAAVAYNASNDKFVSGLLHGKITAYSDTKMLFTDSELSKLFNEAGFEATDNCDVTTEETDETSLCSEKKVLTDNTLIMQKFKEFRGMVDVYHETLYFVRAYKPSLKKTEEFTANSQKNTAGDVFLSVVIRTQGNRIQELREALLSLTAQSCGNFEVLLMLHKPDNEQTEAVGRLAEELPPFMKRKVRIFNIDYGNRSTPLNEGALRACGRYIAFLDDDDYVFENWVETFFDMAKEHDGMLLHAYTARQIWRKTDDASQFSGSPYSVSGYYDLYCRDFDYVQQVVENKCPIMSIAFPREVFDVTNSRFDETLDTTEDWDFIMRNAFTYGVANSSNITSVYRGWENAQSSATIHTKQEWDDYRLKIYDKINNIVPLFPKGVVETFLPLNELEHQREDMRDTTASFTWKVVIKLRNFIHRFIK